MIYLSIAIVISVALICVFGIDVTVNRTFEDYTEHSQPDITFTDVFNEEGDIKNEFDGAQVSMDEYISSINDLMVGSDKEI